MSSLPRNVKVRLTSGLHPATTDGRDLTPRDCIEARRCRCEPGDADRGAYRTNCVRHRVAVAREQDRFWHAVDDTAQFLRRQGVVG